MSTGLDLVKSWLEKLEPIAEKTGELGHKETAALYYDLLLLEKQLTEKKNLQPSAPRDYHTATMLGKCCRTTHTLIAELRLLSPAARQELLDLAEDYVAMQTRLMETLLPSKSS